jgi:hypothetical protein
MLRRVTPDQVAVFVATSESFTAKLRVRQAGSTGSGAWSESPSQTPVSLGGALHVLVITLTPPSALSVDLVYEYDVQFTVASSVKVRTDAGNELPRTTGPFGLSELGLLVGTRRVGLNVGALPSFAIQSSREKLRLIHASCRKPHGGGDDAVPFITELFGPNAATRASDRPHYFLLTGDQIYADDVSTSLLWLIQQTGKELMQGVTETLILPQRPEWPARQVSFPGPDQQSAGEKRQKLMEAFSEVSSEHKESHLVFLAEFYAMYVLVWSPAMWGPGWFVAWKSKSLFPSPEQEARHEYEQLAEDNTWPSKEEERHQSVRTFAQGTSKVRRVLANVSTLMMFDDHEVSDDWNLDQTWRNDSRDGDHPLVQRIVRNALLAFAAFQAWGNNPAGFAAGTAGRKLLTAADPNTLAPSNVFDTPDCVDDLLRLRVTGATPSPSAFGPMLWHWGIDLPGSDYRILALDTRTRRQYSAASETGLLDATAMDDQLPYPPTGDSKVTFVLSPAPVLGHPLLEEVLQPIGKKNGLGRNLDAEAWSMNRECLTDLLHRLARFRQVVLLSGDVHYAYSNRTDFLTRNEAGSASSVQSAIFVQLCSSSAHNEENQTRMIESLGTAGMGRRSWRGRRFATWQDHLPSPNQSIESLIKDRPPDVGDGSSGPVRVDERVMGELVGEIFDGLSIVKVAMMVSASATLSAKKALLAKVNESAPAALAVLYYKAHESTLPTLTESSTNFAFTLPAGPWFSNALRSKIGQILPDPTPTDTGWAWTWTTEFLDGLIESSPSSSTSLAYVQGLQALTRTVIGRPNFGEVTFYPGSGRVESLRHRIHWIDATERSRARVDHILADLSPLPENRTWPPVYQ